MARIIAKHTLILKPGSSALIYGERRRKMLLSQEEAKKKKMREDERIAVLVDKVERADLSLNLTPLCDVVYRSW